MWWLVAVFIVTLVLAYAFMPKPQRQPPPSQPEIQVPTAEVGRTFGVLMGSRIVRSPNCCWYGDLRLVPIKAKAGKKG